MQPIVTIDGATIASSWTFGVPRVALAGLSITWGRSSPLDQPSPNASTIELLDFDLLGVAWRAESWIGARLEVAADDRPLLDGTITAQEASEVRVVVDGRSRPAIRYRLTATDIWGLWDSIHPRGTWAGAVLRGTGGAVYGRTMLPWGNGGWGAAWTTQRLAELAPHVAPWADVAIPTEAWTRPHNALSTATAPRSIQAGVPAGDPITLAEHLRRCYSALAPLGVAELDPAGTVRLVEPARARGLRLGRVGTSIGLLYSGGALDFVAAASIRTDDDRTLPSALADQRVHALTTNVNGEHHTYLPPLVDGSTTLREEQVSTEDESTTLRQRVPAGKASPTELDLQLGATMGTSTPRADGDPLTRAVALQGHDAALANLVESARLAAIVNDYLAPPQLTIIGAGEHLRTTAWGPIALRGNRFAGWDRVPAQYQLIGGEITWDGTEWAHAVTLAPAIDDRRRVLTTAEVFGPITDSTLLDIHPNIGIYDLVLLNTESDSL